MGTRGSRAYQLRLLERDVVDAPQQRGRLIRQPNFEVAHRPRRGTTPKAIDRGDHVVRERFDVHLIAGHGPTVSDHRPANPEADRACSRVSEHATRVRLGLI
jgi:hypothetical protein